MVLTPCSLICAQHDVEAWETPATADHWAKKDPTGSPGSRSKQIKHGELPEILHKNGAFSWKIIRFSSHGAAPDVSSWISSGWPFLRMFTWSEMAISSFPTLKIAILGELSRHFQTPTEHFTAMDLRDLSQTPSRASRTKAASWDHSHGPKAW